MPINVFGNSNSNDNNGNKNDTSLFVQKPYLRSNYIESNVEENIDMKNQYRTTKLPDPLSIREACNKSYVDKIFKKDINFNEVKLEKIKFVKVNYRPAVDTHLTPKVYVDTSISNRIDESSLLRLDPNEILDLDNQDSIILNSTLISPKKFIEIPTKAFIDSLHEENERSRRDLGIDFYDEASDLVKNNQDNNLNDNNLTILDSVVVNRKPSSDNELANKKYIDDQLDKNTFVRFSQTLQNYPKVSVGNDEYNPTKYNKIQLTDVTEIRYPSSGNDLLQKWKIINNNKNGDMKIGKFSRSTRTSSGTENSGATSLPPIGNACMFIESSSNNRGNNTYVTWERTDIIQITNITFYYNRFSILTHDSLNRMGRIRIQLLLEDNTWSDQYTMAKNSQNSNSSPE